MLLSLFSKTLKGLPKFRVPHLFPTQSFSTATQPKRQRNKSKDKKEPKEVKVPKEPRPPKVPKNVDPNLVENLSKYIDGIQPNDVYRVYRTYNFEKNLSPAIKKYQELEFNKIQLKFLFKRKPALLRIANKEEDNDILKISDFVEKKFGMNKHQIRSMILRNPWIIKLNNEQLQKKIDYLQTKMKMTDKEVKRILIIYPKVFSLSEEHLNKTLEIIDMYTAIPDRTLGIIAARFPYFLCIAHDLFMKAFRVLAAYGLSKAEMISIMKRHPEVFTLKAGTLKQNLRMFIKNRLTGRTLASVVSSNPRLLTVDSSRLLSRKFRLFKRYRIAWPQIWTVLKRSPRLFIKSYTSSVLKFKYLAQKMRINIRDDPAFPAIFNYSYANVIRPRFERLNSFDFNLKRGELMFRKDKIIPWKDVLGLTDEQFVEKMESNLEELNKIKAEYTEPDNNELECNQRFFSKYFSNRGLRAKY